MIHRMDPPRGSGARADAGGVEPMLAMLADAARATTTAGRTRSSGTGCGRSPTARPAGMRLESRTLQRRHRPATPSCARLGRRARLDATRSSTASSSPSTTSGSPSFERLQQRMHHASRVAPSGGGWATARSPTWSSTSSTSTATTVRRSRTRERRERLEGLELDGPKLADARATTAATARSCSAAPRERGLEGLVAKRLDSRYAPGRRTRAWLKVKNPCARSW